MEFRYVNLCFNGKRHGNQQSFPSALVLQTFQATETVDIDMGLVSLQAPYRRYSIYQPGLYSTSGTRTTTTFMRLVAQWLMGRMSLSEYHLAQ
jgi:hypothetical protein